MKDDTVTREQIHAFAEHLRRATSAELAIAIACARSEEVEGSQALVCGVSGNAAKEGNQRQLQTEANLAVIRVADSILRETTGGELHLRIVDQAGNYHELGASDTTHLEHVERSRA